MSMLLILPVGMLLFRAPKLPAIARSLGQSMRILKSEVTQLKEDQPIQADVSFKGRAAHENQGATAPRS
nr:twin-arginine translocase TatA/TatE family subunit [Kocuria sediminis]